MLAGRLLPDRSTDPLRAAYGGGEGAAVLISIATAKRVYERVRNTYFQEK